jgi:glycosyltransferase involved in cell wall biosynthesis
VKIAVFGNTNNYPLLLTLGLRRLGHEAVLIVNSRDRLHRPESKYPELQHRYPPWILDCSDIAEDEFVTASPKIGHVLDVLGGYADALVLNDLGPSLLEFCDKPAVVFLTGSDLTYYADPKTVAVRHHDWSPEYSRNPSARLWTRRWHEFIERQRAGIRNARGVSAAAPGLVPQMDSLLRDIGVDESRREFFYFADVDNPPKPPAAAHGGPLRIVNGARLNWKKPMPGGFSSQDHKGSDVLLRGFAEFMQAGGNAELVLFRKGLHVAETEALASELGIAEHIRWRGEMTLREFYRELTDADIVCDQFGDSFPGMVAMDAMAIGLPVVAHFRLESMAPCFQDPIPGFHAETPSEIAAHFETLAASPRLRIDAGRAARRFARTHLSPVANARRCLRHLGVD